MRRIIILTFIIANIPLYAARRQSIVPRNWARHDYYVQQKIAFNKALKEGNSAQAKKILMGLEKFYRQTRLSGAELSNWKKQFKKGTTHKKNKALSNKFPKNTGLKIESDESEDESEKEKKETPLQKKERLQREIFILMNRVKKKGWMSDEEAGEIGKMLNQINALIEAQGKNQGIDPNELDPEFTARFEKEVATLPPIR